MPDMSALDEILSEIAQSSPLSGTNRQTSHYTAVKNSYPNGSSNVSPKGNGANSLPRNRPSLPKMQRAYEGAAASAAQERSSTATASCWPDLNVPSSVSGRLNKSSSAAAAYHHLSSIKAQHVSPSGSTNGLLNGLNGPHVDTCGKDTGNSSTFPRRSATLPYPTAALSTSLKHQFDSNNMFSQVTLRRSVSPISAYKEESRKAAEIPCPFGTFLNLDFVHFCSELAIIRLPESVTRFRESSSKRKKKWRKSMDQMLYSEQVLLHHTTDLDVSALLSLPANNGRLQKKAEEASVERMEADSQELLSEAVRTFDQTLMRQMSHTYQSAQALRIVEEYDEDLPLSVASNSTTTSNEKESQANGCNGYSLAGLVASSAESYRESLFTVPHMRAPKASSSSSSVFPLVTSTEVNSNNTIKPPPTTDQPSVQTVVISKGSSEVETCWPASFRQTGPKSSSSTTSLNLVSIPAEVLEGIRDKLAHSITQMGRLQEQADMVPQLREEISALRLMLQQVGQQHEEKKVIVVDTGVLTSPVPDARHDNDDNREHVGELAVTIIVECQNMATNTEAEAPTERRDWATSYSPIPDFASSFAQTEPPLHQHDEESQVQEPEENGEALTVRPLLERKISRSARKSPRSKFTKRKQSIASKRRRKSLPKTSEVLGGSLETNTAIKFHDCVHEPISLPIAVIDELDIDKDELELLEEAELMKDLDEAAQEGAPSHRPLSEEVISDNEVASLSPPFSLLGDAPSSPCDVDAETLVVLTSCSAQLQQTTQDQPDSLPFTSTNQDQFLCVTETSIVFNERDLQEEEEAAGEKLTFVEVYDSSNLSPIHEEGLINEEETGVEDIGDDQVAEELEAIEAATSVEPVVAKECNQADDGLLFSGHTEELDMVSSLSSASDNSHGVNSNSDPDEEGSYDLLHGEISHQCPEGPIPLSQSLYKAPASANMPTMDDNEEAKVQGLSADTSTPSAPSKELLAAAKVLKDSLHRASYTTSNREGRSGQTRNQDSSKRIIQQEWFSVAGRKDANAQTVDNYIDVFESFSKKLLLYVVNLLDNNGNTVLHYALSHNNFDVVSVLLDSKVCNVDIVNQAGYTPVMLASLAVLTCKAHLAVTTRLFGMGDINRRAQQHGQTALMLAVSHGRVDTVKMLLDVGADVNIQDNDGSTALMCASEHGHIEIVRLLLRHPDVNIEMTDGDGMNALYVALEAGHRDIAALLYNRRSSLPEGNGDSSQQEDRRQSLDDTKRPTRGKRRGVPSLGISGSRTATM